MNKAELQDLLKKDFGMEDKDFKNDEGKPMTKTQLEKLLEDKQLEQTLEEPADEVVDVVDAVEKESEKEENVKEDEADELPDFFDGDTINGTDKVFEENELIQVMSGVYGLLTHRPLAGGGEKNFSGFGQVQRFPYKELVQIYNLYPTNFTDGTLVILNKDLIKEFGLTDLYKNILTPEKLKGIANLSFDKFKDLIESVPRDMRVTIFDMVRKLHKVGKIDSVKIIKYLEDTYDISLDDNQPVNDGKLESYDRESL